MEDDERRGVRRKSLCLSRGKNVREIYLCNIQMSEGCLCSIMKWGDKVSRVFLHLPGGYSAQSPSKRPRSVSKRSAGSARSTHKNSARPISLEKLSSSNLLIELRGGDTYFLPPHALLREQKGRRSRREGGSFDPQHVKRRPKGPPPRRPPCFLLEESSSILSLSSRYSWRERKGRRRRRKSRPRMRQECQLLPWEGGRSERGRRALTRSQMAEKRALSLLCLVEKIVRGCGHCRTTLRRRDTA